MKGNIFLVLKYKSFIQILSLTRFYSDLSADWIEWMRYLSTLNNLTPRAPDSAMTVQIKSVIKFNALIYLKAL